MQTVTSRDGVRIAYDQEGHGPALIVVEGASATRADAASLAAALAPYFTTLTYDRRGRGDSGDSEDTALHVVEREGDDIAALIEAAGGSAFLFGHSSGAVLALEAARLLPGKITKLALYEPPFIVDDSRSPAPEGFAARLGQLVASGRRGEAVEAFMAFVGTSPQMIAGMRQAPFWPRLEASARSFVYDATIAEPVQRGDSAALRRWEAVAVPTLIMDGTLFLGRPDGHAFMRHGADALAMVLPNAQRLTLDGQDHGAANEALVPALRAFFLG